MKEGEKISGHDPLADIFNAIVESAKGNYVPDETQKERLKICEDCSNFTVTRQCSECVCLMDWKTRLIKAECPLAKWTTYNGAQ